MAVQYTYAYPFESAVLEHQSAPAVRLATSLDGRLFTHWIIDWHGEQFTAVGTLHFRGTGDGSRGDRVRS
ncbi:MAG TPA: hypothetical protein EYQ75_14410 [Planctomycetaceae bacterium]|nr:hypothetical protein [Planctomycetaceae bacterium]